MAAHTHTLAAIFDFDQTLAVDEVAEFDEDVEDARETVMGGLERCHEVGAHLRGLAEQGVLLGIISFNTLRTIRSVLQCLGWAHLFGDRIWGDMQVCGHNFSKGSCLQEEVLRAFAVRAEDAIFVDDSADNCRDVLRTCPGVTVVHVVRGSGMRPTEMGQVSAWVADRMHAKSSAQTNEGRRDADGAHKGYDYAKSAPGARTDGSMPTVRGQRAAAIQTRGPYEVLVEPVAFAPAAQSGHGETRTARGIGAGSAALRASSLDRLPV